MYLPVNPVEIGVQGSRVGLVERDGRGAPNQLRCETCKEESRTAPLLLQELLDQPKNQPLPYPNQKEQESKSDLGALTLNQSKMPSSYASQRTAN
ncbi:hypothetical protein PSTG_00898 [Puccinia striiformis f. sp. tritici PST-78]|uniref:Uncharacterized protein n=1 Tax=Puccinia striiformis f. sp. tritici PST-78 TaxID=1165861 RepID=A0A0L0W3Q5_9BASI|nr:hypothetical protein PSTG_00898 [Puccinia striiformis f. sp. tritici PST-78]